MKKKKLTVNRLALGNLRTRRKQYTLMILGIILAMTFSSAAMFFAICSEDSKLENKWLSIGKQDFILTKCDGFDLESYKKQGVLTDYATIDVVSYAYSPDDNFDDGTGVAVYNDKAREIAYHSFIEGRYPEAEGEIAIESDALYRMNLNAKVGDKITLNTRAANGEEFLSEDIKKTYTLVGIINDRRYDLEQWYGLNNGERFPQYPAAIVYDREKVGLGGKEKEIAFVCFNWESHKNSIEFTDDYRQYILQSDIDMKVEQHKTEHGLTDRIVAEYNYFHDTRSASIMNNWAYYDLDMILGLGTVLACVLAIASCFGVVNAFNTNLQERRKQIGMLRAVGATKRQIVRIFGREALIISLATAPISVAAGCLGVWIFSYLMGDNYVFKPEWYVILFVGVIGICFVMAAALIPLFHAARVTPMQAIRNTELGRKMKNKKIKSQKEFNPQKLLAKRNLTFNRFRQISVSIILIATIIVSCVCVSLLENEIKNFEESYDYRVFCRNDKGYQIVSAAFANYFNKNVTALQNSDIADIEDNRYVDEAHGVLGYAVNWLVDGEYPDYLKLSEFTSHYNYSKYENDLTAYAQTPEEIRRLFENPIISEDYKELMEYVDYDAEPFGTVIHAVNETELGKFTDYVIDGEINIDKINSGEEIVLVAPEEICYEVGYDKDGSISFYGTSYVNNGLKEISSFPNNDTIEVMREKMPFKAGETVNLSILISYDRDEETLPEREGAYCFDFERYDREVKIGAIVTKRFTEGLAIHEPSFLTTTEGFTHFGCKMIYEYIDFNINQEITPEIEEEVEGFIRSMNYEFNSNYRMDEMQKNELKTLVAGILSIILLLFCVAASLVNNSLTSKIRESKKEIGTLRAVGANAKELTTSYIHQLLSMFGTGCGLGFGVYTAVFVIAKLFCIYYFKIQFPLSYHILPAVIICLLLFAVCSANLYVNVKKQMKYSIVENIREL